MTRYIHMYMYIHSWSDLHSFSVKYFVTYHELLKLMHYGDKRINLI